MLTVPAHLQDQTISRLKIISGMDIAERRKPQDGRSRLRFEGRRIDLRVSTLPTQFGEKVVIRLLNSDEAITPLDDLGFSPENLRLMRSFLSRPQGMLLVTGPDRQRQDVDALHRAQIVKSPTNNIITLEDPIELQVEGVNQMQVNPRAGVTFATGLRSILRQDPNIILVGEIRDAETAGIALQAAQTGHLLLSTLHTNDAPATITRLLDLGVAAVHGRVVACRHRGAAAGAARLPVVRGAAAAESPKRSRRIGGPSRLPADAAVGRWTGLREVRQCGLQGPAGDPRSPAGQR